MLLFTALFSVPETDHVLLIDIVPGLWVKLVYMALVLTEESKVGHRLLGKKTIIILS